MSAGRYLVDNSSQAATGPDAQTKDGPSLQTKPRARRHHAWPITHLIASTLGSWMISMKMFRLISGTKPTAKPATPRVRKRRSMVLTAFSWIAPCACCWTLMRSIGNTVSVQKKGATTALPSTAHCRSQCNRLVK
eukprot:FR736588.1.p1 GENE.FR736588.1~~FR736588.1.p1  ORF type:complete len:135 (+),score=6.82 FR736588.1:355-759(+)